MEKPFHLVPFLRAALFARAPPSIFVRSAVIQFTERSGSIKILAYWSAYLSLSPSLPLPLAALLNPQAWNALNASNHFGCCYSECNIRRLLRSSILYSMQKRKKKDGERKKVTLSQPDIPRIGWFEKKKRRKKRKKGKSLLVLFARIRQDEMTRKDRRNFLERRRGEFIFYIDIKGEKKGWRNFHWFYERIFTKAKTSFPLLFRRNNGRFVTKTKNGDTWACLMTANLNLGEERGRSNVLGGEERSVHACLFKRPSLATRHDLIKANFTVQVIFEPIIEFVLCIKPLKSLKII